MRRGIRPSGPSRSAAVTLYTVTVTVNDDDGARTSESQTKLVTDNCDCTKSQGFWKHQLSTNGRHQFNDPTLRMRHSATRVET